MTDHLNRQLKAMPAFRGLLRAVEAKFYDDLILPEPVLDVGCGDGHFASEAFKFRVRAGIDPWSDPLKETAQYGVYDTLAQADGAFMPFADNTFASGVSNSVLEHIPSVEPVLAEVARVLKPNAPFVFCSPSDQFTNMLSISNFFYALKLRGAGDAYVRLFDKISRHKYYKSPQEWSETLSRNGLVVDRWWYYFSPAALHALEWGHYLGLPSLISKKLFNEWILWKSDINLSVTDWLLRRYYNEPLPKKGAYIFVVAHKRA